MPRLTILIRGVTERLLQKRNDLVTGTGTMKNVFQYLKDLHLSFAKTMTLIFFGIKQNMNHQMGFMGISVQYNRGLLFIVAQTEEDLPLKNSESQSLECSKVVGTQQGLVIGQCCPNNGCHSTERSQPHSFYLLLYFHLGSMIGNMSFVFQDVQVHKYQIT